jgi:hypothetical protein
VGVGVGIIVGTGVGEMVGTTVGVGDGVTVGTGDGLIGMILELPVIAWPMKFTYADSPAWTVKNWYSLLPMFPSRRIRA